MRVLPARLRDEEFVRELFLGNLESWFFEPRHWRLAFADIRKAGIEFLSFQPPQFDFLIHVTLKNGQSVQFYEGVVAKAFVGKTERIFGKATIGRSSVFFVDGYTNSLYIENLFEAWCSQRKLGALGFEGHFLGFDRDARVTIRKQQPLSKPGEEATTNYLYRYRGSLKSSTKQLVFDVVAKRFLPRTPFNRGNNEYSILRALPSSIVPKTHGALVNQRSSANDESQVLVLFSDFLPGAFEIGKLIWDLMKTISQRQNSEKSPKFELKLLADMVQEAVERVVFPFHQTGFRTWHSAKVTIKPGDEYYESYHLELEHNLGTMKSTEVMNASRARELSQLFRTAWAKVLSEIVATEIHGDLMWRQILKTKDKRLVILDLDEHVKGHAAKDIAGLCAANLFIAEDLQSPDREYMRNVADDLNALILKRYMKNAKEENAPWAANLEEAVQIYLAYRQLHDAAYYAPVWRQARRTSEKKKYKRYVDFSIDSLEKSAILVNKMLER